MADQPMIYIGSPDHVIREAKQRDQSRELVDALSYAAKQNGNISIGETPLTPREEVIFSWAVHLGKGLEAKKQEDN